MTEKRDLPAPAELAAFRAALRREFRNLFERRPITVVRVPARLDVMGGIADYSGAHVCEYPLAHGAVLGIQKRRDRRVHITSAGIEKHNYANHFETTLDAFYRGGRLLAYRDICRNLPPDEQHAWAAYVVGTIFVLLKEQKVAALSRGFNIGLLSHVPMNVGIGSSATVEVATLYGLDQLLDLRLEPLELARLGQVTENRVVGAPCGIMDQITVACGVQRRLLHIICDPATIAGTAEVPDFCAFAGINSMVKHSVGGAKYTDVRVATFMGRKIIFDRLRETGRLRRDEQPFGGHLANVPPEDYARLYRSWLPEQLTGADFLKRYGSTEDPVAAVVPEKTYRVESCASHPIGESARVQRFLSCVVQARLTGQRDFLVEAGELMYAAHRSYAVKCSLSCPEVDFLVETARRLGVREGVYGAKITGGGSGGTVAVLAEKDRLAAATEKIVDAYRREYGLRADVFTGSSPGAYAFGSAKISP